MMHKCSIPSEMAGPTHGPCQTVRTRRCCGRNVRWPASATWQTTRRRDLVVVPPLDLARHGTGIRALLSLRIPRLYPCHRAHRVRPLLQLLTLGLLVTMVILALVVRVIVHVAVL